MLDVPDPGWGSPMAPGRSGGILSRMYANNSSSVLPDHF